MTTWQWFRLFRGRGNGWCDALIKAVGVTHGCKVALDPSPWSSSLCRGHGLAGGLAQFSGGNGMDPLDKCVRCGAPTYSGVQHICDDTTGWRSNAGKPRYDLLPPDAIEELVQVYTKGAEKYAPRNWERGMPWCSTCFAALLRHAFAWLRGETHDPETGCHHMAHVAWNALALVAYSKRGVGTDDRPGVTDG